MPVHMDGVLVPAVVVHDEPITLSFRHREQRVRIGPRFSIDGPAIVATPSAWDLFELESDGLVRSSRRSGSLAECGVVPRLACGSRPCGLAAPVGVLDD